MRAPFAVLGAVTVFGFLSVMRFWAALDFPSHPGARGAAAFLREHTLTNEPVVVSSPFVYVPVSFHLGCDSRAQCPDGRAVRLYSDTGEFLHFAGGPILSTTDLVGPALFASSFELPASSLPTRLWVADTTGFGGSRLAVPPPWTLAREERFPELFAFQGDIVVRAYQSE